MNELITIAEQHGFAWLISIVAIIYAVKRLSDSDKIIANNTKVTEEFQKFLQSIEKNNSLILREQEDQNTIIRELHNRLSAHDDRSEKILTQAKLNESGIRQLFHKIDLKLDAIVRESFDRRTLAKINKDVEKELREVEDEV